MEENQDNVCKNCKFFVEYYIKCRSRFKPISFGHCINKNSRKIIYDSDTCEKFQKRDYESDKKLIEKKIEEIAQDISDLIQIKASSKKFKFKISIR